MGIVKLGSCGMNIDNVVRIERSVGYGRLSLLFIVIMIMVNNIKLIRISSIFI